MHFSSVIENIKYTPEQAKLIITATAKLHFTADTILLNKYFFMNFLKSQAQFSTSSDNVCGASDKFTILLNGSDGWRIHNLHTHTHRHKAILTNPNSETHSFSEHNVAKRRVDCAARVMSFVLSRTHSLKYIIIIYSIQNIIKAMCKLIVMFV